jgi:sigma-B regulation protein RsbU (phosphoserine phosphatase)
MSPQQQPAVLRTLGQDAGQLWTEVRRTGPKRTIGRTFLDLQEFYLDAGRQDRLRGMGRMRRAIYLVAFLLKSLFLKLTPARRVLLVLSVVLIWQATEVGRRGEFAPSGSNFPVLGVAMLLLILMLELKDKLTAREELEAGRAVQRALMPDHNPAIPGWDVWLFTRSANDVGGDLVDAVPIADGRFGLALGDVAGKGLPAALLMAKLQATLRALASGERSLAVLGEKTNRILCRDGLPNRFATLVYLEVVAGSGSVRVLNAGHLPPLVLRGTTLEELPIGSMALGMVSDTTFSERDVALADGDVLVAFSDGLTEAMNERDEFFGDERLRARLSTLAGMTAENVGTRVVAAVDEFVGDTRPHDDLSLVVLRRAS